MHLRKELVIQSDSHLYLQGAPAKVTVTFGFTNPIFSTRTEDFTDCQALSAYGWHSLIIGGPISRQVPYLYQNLSVLL